MVDGDPLKLTPLHAAHQRARAKMVPFGGWAMPLDYGSILAEHAATRTAAGLFDLSHMGEVLVSGPEALSFLQTLVTNDVAALPVGKALYSPMCRDDGTIVDDVVVYRLPPLPLPARGVIAALSGPTDPTYLVVVNAATTTKDLAWMAAVHQRLSLGDRVIITDRSADVALVAVQGPRAVEVVQAAMPATEQAALAALPRFAALLGTVAGVVGLVARTGYTGEDGFEIFTATSDGQTAWEWFITHGAALGLRPCGLGARDTLRLEARLPLYGNDIDDTTTPIEAGLGWTVKLAKQPACLGHDVLSAQRAHGPARLLTGLVMADRAVPRAGYRVLDSTGQRALGSLTSGAPSPTLGVGIALGYLAADAAIVGQTVLVDIRGRGDLHPATLTRGPFYRRPTE